MKKNLYLRIRVLILVFLLILSTLIIVPEQVLADTEVTADEETNQVAADEETHQVDADEEMPQITVDEKVTPDVSDTEDQHDVEQPDNEAVSETDTDLTDGLQEMPDESATETETSSGIEEVVRMPEAEQVAEEAVTDNPADQDDNVAVPDNAEHSRGTREYTPEGDFLFDPRTGTITGYIGESKNVNIPPKINEVDVKHIGDVAFQDKSLESVTIPEGVETIGEYAFNLNNLERVTIPDGVRIIGRSAFYMNGLMEIGISDSVTEIGYSAFACNGLTSVIIPDSITSIGIAAFKHNNLTYVKIPDGVESIGEDAFILNSVILATIPEGIGSIVLKEGDPITNPTIEEVGSHCFDSGIYLNTFYIEANYNIHATPNGEVITKLWRPLYVTGTNVVKNNDDYWLEFTYNGNPAYVIKEATTNTPPEITGYATGILNLRFQPGGPIIDTIPMGYQVNGLLVKNMVETTYNGKIGYVYASLLQKDPVQVTRYIKAGSNIRKTPGGTIIETLKMPIFVSGTITGNYLRFTYKGQTAYVPMSLTTTQNPPITGYAKSNVNVRSSPNGGVIGSLSIGRKVSGTLTGNWVRFTYAGKTGYVYSSLLQADPVNLTCYVKAGSNLRSAPGGTIIATLKMPIFVTGTNQGSYLKFTYKGQTAYVAMGLTTTTSPPITGYTKSAVNVRSSPGGSVIGTLPANRKVSGTLVGNWVKFNYSGKTGYIYASLLK
ncbi:MAG: leucine-rich repeat protein [Saccharofermentanales bacterium]|jgi:uncharacterized protein YgiM (DUF1202 family)